MRLALALQVVVSFCVFNFTVYVPLLATTVLGLGSEGFGLLMAALGVGAVSAGLSIGALGSRVPRPRGIGLALAVSCGFGVLMLSQVPANARLGLLVVLGLVDCLIASLLILPVLVHWWPLYDARQGSTVDGSRKTDDRRETSPGHSSTQA